MSRRRIVVGVDGSEGSTAALYWAIGHAPLLDAELVVVHSMDLPVAMPPPAMAGDGFVVDDQVRATMREALEQWCKPARDSGVAYRAELYEGNPVGALTQVADAEQATFIVVGRRGGGGFAELVLGSVPHSLANHATVPVMIVPTA